MNLAYCTVVRVAELAAELQSIPLVRIPDKSGHGHYGGPDGWIHGLSNTRIRMGETYPLATLAVEDLQETENLGDVKQVLVNMLEPGAHLDAHRDGYPDHARYHLPVITNNEAYWWDEYDGKRNMVIGTWYGPVPHCGILHSAGNPGLTPRLHLVVDFDK